MSRGRPALVVVALALVGCSPAPAGVGRTSSAIIGGAPTTGDDAVVMLVSYPPDHGTFDACTASLVSADVLLTAAHCVDPDTHPGWSFGVFDGPDASAYETANTLIPRLLAVREVHAHPDYERTPPFGADVGVAVLAEPLARAPLAIGRETLDEATVGRPARIVGYGQTTYGEPGSVRHEATTVVAALGEDDTVVVGDLDHRSCIGDSGGPALVEQDGIERIIGVDSYAELSGCLEPAHYRRTDRYLAFLDEWVPPPDAVEPDAGADGADGGVDAGDTGATGRGGGGGCSSGASRPGGAAWSWLVPWVLLWVVRRGARRTVPGPVSSVHGSGSDAVRPRRVRWAAVRMR